MRAAELFREDQARHVISSVRIVQTSEDPHIKPRILHAYVNLIEKIGEDIERGYVPLARVMEDADLLRKAMDQAAADLRALEDRYREFELIALAISRARVKVETAA